MLRKNIEVVVTDEDMENLGTPSALENAIKRTLKPNYQSVTVDDDEITITGRQFSYAYPTPPVVQALLDGGSGAKVHSLSFALGGSRSKRRL